MNTLNKFRYDYILIWGNGLVYKNQILSMIEENPDFEIIKIIKHKVRDIKDLVNNVYSYDYAPIEHLKEKIKYLYSTKPEVLFIFIKNKNKNEDYLGHGDYRHVESLTLKAFKEEIRNKFNERKNDRQTENHVVHASDNELQTDYILKYLGFENGVKTFYNLEEEIFEIPHHINTNGKFIVKTIDIDLLFASIIEINSKGIVKTKKLEETPHYKTLVSNGEDYYNYIKSYEGKYLQDGYSLKKFLNLKEKLVYPYKNKFIVVRKDEANNRYVILDGLHRASILKYRNVKKVTVAEICNE